MCNLIKIEANICRFVEKIFSTVYTRELRCWRSNSRHKTFYISPSLIPPRIALARRWARARARKLCESSSPQPRCGEAVGASSTCALARTPDRGALGQKPPIDASNAPTDRPPRPVPPRSKAQGPAKHGRCTKLSTNQWAPEAVPNGISRKLASSLAPQFGVKRSPPQNEVQRGWPDKCACTSQTRTPRKKSITFQS